jgi:hypothetical protein
LIGVQPKPAPATGAVYRPASDVRFSNVALRTGGFSALRTE